MKHSWDMLIEEVGHNERCAAAMIGVIHFICQSFNVLISVCVSERRNTRVHLTLLAQRTFSKISCCPQDALCSLNNKMPSIGVSDSKEMTSSSFYKELRR